MEDPSERVVFHGFRSGGFHSVSILHPQNGNRQTRRFRVAFQRGASACITLVRFAEQIHRGLATNPGTRTRESVSPSLGNRNTCSRRTWKSERSYTVLPGKPKGFWASSTRLTGSSHGLVFDKGQLQRPLVIQQLFQLFLQARHA